MKGNTPGMTIDRTTPCTAVALAPESRKPCSINRRRLLLLDVTAWLVTAVAVLPAVGSLMHPNNEFPIAALSLVAAPVVVVVDLVLIAACVRNRRYPGGVLAALGMFVGTLFMACR